MDKALKELLLKHPELGKKGGSTSGTKSPAEKALKKQHDSEHGILTAAKKALKAEDTKSPGRRWHTCTCNGY